MLSERESGVVIVLVMCPASVLRAQLFERAGWASWVCLWLWREVPRSNRSILKLQAAAGGGEGGGGASRIC